MTARTRRNPLNRRWFVLLSLIVLSSCLAPSRPALDDASLAAWLEQQRQRHQLPALGVVLVDNQQILATAVTGLRSRQHQVPVTLEDQWHLGSITKSMTATLAALLVADGLIGFDDRVGDWLGDRYPDMHPAYAGVSLAALLRHHGGLPEDLQGLPLWQEMDIVNTSPVEQRHQLLLTLLPQPPAVTPGDYLYSNAGYVLAGTMLEAATGLCWEDLIEQRLLLPLQLTSAGIGAPGQSRETPDQPWGHRRQAPGEPMPPGPFSDHPAALAPAGRVHMALPDLARYLQLHLTVAMQAKTELSPAENEAVSALHQPAPQSQVAAGWFLEPTARSNADVLAHSGSNTFWQALLQIAPSEGIAIAVVSNALPQDLQALEQIAAAVADSYSTGPGIPPTHVTQTGQLDRQ